MKTTQNKPPFEASAWVPATMHGQLLQGVYGNTPEETVEKVRAFFRKHPQCLRENGRGPERESWWIPAVVRVSVYPTGGAVPVMTVGLVS